MYTYPIDYEQFTTVEIIEIVSFLNLVEEANEGKVDKNKLIQQYQNYQSIVNSKAMEKQIDKAFKNVSGYSVYQTIKTIK
ncbi:MAG: UPF0223 family protein [Candidatus Izimaplasma sp.]|nr:UPF0223 family protein [Candidatus Izimaplasma bacterium]